MFIKMTMICVDLKCSFVRIETSFACNNIGLLRYSHLRKKKRLRNPITLKNTFLCEATLVGCLGLSYRFRAILLISVETISMKIQLIFFQN